MSHCQLRRLSPMPTFYINNSPTGHAPSARTPGFGVQHAPGLPPRMLWGSIVRSDCSRISASPQKRDIPELPGQCQLRAGFEERSHCHSPHGGLARLYLAFQHSQFSKCMGHPVLHLCGPGRRLISPCFNARWIWMTMQSGIHARASCKPSRPRVSKSVTVSRTTLTETVQAHRNLLRQAQRCLTASTTLFIKSSCALNVNVTLVLSRLF